MKRHSLKRSLRLLLFIFLSLAPASFCQSDAQHFAEGRLALDKYKDCAAAEKALKAVTPRFRQNAAWLMYMARTEECQKQFASALSYYKQYDALMPGNSDVLNKIGDLSYQMHKDEESKVRQELEGTWVSVIPATERSFGDIIRLTITSNGEGYSGIFRDADFVQSNNTLFAVYSVGTLAVQRTEQTISISWKNAAQRSSLESSDSAFYPQDSSGSLSNDKLTLRLQWSAQSWETPTFVKSTSTDGVSTVNAALQILDKFIDLANLSAKLDRSDAEQQRGFARDDQASARHFSDDDGDNKAARASRSDAARETENANDKMKSSRENSAAAAQANNYKQNWSSLLQ
jgi:hypothetical protein